MWGRGNETERLTRSLTEWLAPVCATGMTSVQTTKLITDRIQQWALRQRWAVELEAPALLDRDNSGTTRRGRLDLLCTRPWPRSPVAIEIDRVNKLWSLEKLCAEADAGNVALWVRWRGDTLIEVPPTIGLIDIRATIDNPRTSRRRVRGADPSR